MNPGLIGTKRGMTRLFKDDGSSVPVTLVEIQPNKVTQLRTAENDGYDAVQVASIETRAKSLNAPKVGHLKKAGVEPSRILKEFKFADDLELALGAEVTIDAVFQEGDSVDVTGTSKGKGYAGTVKRWNFSTQDATHGNSLSHRAPGSIGQNQTPGRVFKGKKMAGRLGGVQVTTQSLQIVKIDLESRVIAIKGAVPGAVGSYVIVKPAVKS